MKNSLLSLIFILGATPLFAQYCTPTSVPCSGDYIANVTFGGINRTSVCDSLSTGYGYYPNYVAIASPGQTLPISLTPGTLFPQAFIVWIDLNMDYTFSPNEIVFSSPNISYTTVTGSVTIPAGSSSGVTRMRVRCADYINTLSNDACLNMTFGETEDYLVSLDGLPTSVSSIAHNSELMIFPNPANNLLSIKSYNNIIGSQVDILNIFGQKIHSEKLNSNENLDIHSLSNGIYVLSVNGMYQRFTVNHD